MPSNLTALRSKALRNVAKNKTHAQNLLAEIRNRSTRIAKDAHAVGKALIELSQERIYTVLGYDSFADLLAGEELMSRTTAHRLMAIAETYSAEQIAELGVRKAYALLSYAEATPKLDHAALLFASNARIGNKYIQGMTVRDINAAAKRVRSSVGRGKPKSEPEKRARTEARKLQARLRKQGFRQAKAMAVREGAKWRVQLTVDTHDASELA